MKQTLKRSPLKEEPLRLPGEYLRTQIDKILERFYLILGIAAVAIGLTFVEWICYLFDLPQEPHPWVFTIFTIIICFCAYLYFQKLVQKGQNYRLGHDGEVVVGQLLEGLRVNGFVPIHDVPCEKKGKRFNVDHVLIGPKGIFAFETKTWRKSNGRHETINYRDGHLLIGSNLRDTGSITQARINAEFIRDIFSRRMGEQISVQPILLFPGWFVEQTATATVKKEHNVFMLNPKSLGGFLAKFPDLLEQEKVERLVLALSSYIHEEVIREEE